MINTTLNRSQLGGKAGIHKFLFWPQITTYKKVWPSLRTDFKFIGKVESQLRPITIKKIKFLLILHNFFSKTNRFTNLYAKPLRKKTWNIVHGLVRF